MAGFHSLGRKDPPRHLLMNRFSADEVAEMGRVAEALESRQPDGHLSPSRLPHDPRSLTELLGWKLLHQAPIFAWDRRTLACLGISAEALVLTGW